MIPRFSLYGDPQRWSNDIQIDMEGRWCKWNDVLPYVEYAITHGYVPPVPVDPTPQRREDMAVSDVKDRQIEMYSQDELPTVDDEDERDVFELMTGHNGVKPEDEV